MYDSVTLMKYTEFRWRKRTKIEVENFCALGVSCIIRSKINRLDG